MTAVRAEEPPKNWAGLDVMNGFRLSDYPDFEKKWNLVTVRFRRDTGELRFTYANPVAWAAMMKNAKDYPPGSVFAKIGFMTGEDARFPSSAVPSGAKRFQLMVRDPKKFADTDGWGYALFQGNGLTYPDEPKAASMACAACHRLVQDRGFVFSEPMTLNPSLPGLAAHGERLSFKDGRAADLPKALASRLPAKTGKIRFLTGDIQKNVFNGTLNEIRPALAMESLKSGVPAALVTPDGKDFVAVFTDPTAKKCRSEKASHDMVVVTTAIVGDEKDPRILKADRPVASNSFCW